MLLIRDHEILDPLRDGVIGIGHLHLEGADRRMSRVRRAEHVPEIGIAQAHVGRIVQEQRRPAGFHELADGLALLGLHPELRPGTAARRRGWVEHQLRAACCYPRGIGALVASVTVRPNHSIAQHDQDLVAVQRFRVQ